MRILILALLLSACVRDLGLPDVGKCAQYPEGAYEFGQIGIGTCLAGPNGLEWAGDVDNPTLLVTNANPFRVFDGGSLLAIPWSNIDLNDDRNLIHTLDPVAMALPNFAGGMAINGTLGFIGVRESDAGRTRVSADEVHLVDLSDPAHPAPALLGPKGKSTVKVMSDPVDVVVDPEEGLVYVANRTSHTISVLDTDGDEVRVINPWPKSIVTAAAYEDLSGVGGTARMTRFEILSPELLPSDEWTLTWVEGSWRIWLPTLDGLERSTTHGDGTYRASAMGVELALEDAPRSVEEIADPSLMSGDPARMYFVDSGTIRGAGSIDYLGDWAFDGAITLAGRAGEWDATLGGPQATSDEERFWLFYDGQPDGALPGTVSSIGAAVSDEAVFWSRESDLPVLEPTHSHEGEHIADPHVVYDFEANQWRMYYSAWDGERWTIGHATSDDLSIWTSDEQPIFEGLSSVAAPVVHHTVGSWRMWFSNWDEENSRWVIGAATSDDGTHWSQGQTAIEPAVGSMVHDLLLPPGVALQGSATDAFRVEGEHAGPLSTPFPPDGTFYALTQGWAANTVAGAWLDLGDAGPSSNGGIRIDSIDPGIGRAWLTLTNRNGRPRIGTAEMGEDGRWLAQRDAIFEGGDSKFERGGVSHPVVFRDGNTWRMLYAGVRNGKQSIGLATSADGLSWSAEGKVLGPGSDWDAVAVIPNRVQVLSGGGWRLWYSGFDGARWRIGTAQSSDGEDWSRTPTLRGHEFAPGAPGEWDDSGVQDAWVITDETGDHLWYAGFDGDVWRGGYAFRADGADEWLRATIGDTEQPRPVLDTIGGLFHPDGVQRPVVLLTSDGWEVWFSGINGDASRVGRAFGTAPDALHKTPRRPAAGDLLRFRTEKGDADAIAIPLDQYIDGANASGVGLTSLTLDPDRGVLYAVSKLLSYIYVIDIRDDSDPNGTGFRDLNYLNVEALLIAESSAGATGYRQVVPVPSRAGEEGEAPEDSNALYVLSDAPEAVIRFDLSRLEDNAFPDLIRDAPVGWLAAPRGDERDKGESTMSSVGPGQMVIHPDGRRLFVTNFNRNSITTYDLGIGPHGQLVHETTLVGENPYTMLLTHDGRHLVFANYTGELEGLVANATLGILDVDEDSPTYLEVRTWVANR